MGWTARLFTSTQQAGFLWAKADLEDSGYIINKGILYSIWTPFSISPEYPRTPSNMSPEYPCIVLPPPGFQEAVIDRSHAEVGLLATQMTLARLRESYMWPNMRQSMKKRLNKCATCAVHQKCQDDVAMGEMPLPASPMQVVSMNLLGPFVASTRKNKYILTIIDHCSGWAEAIPIPDKQTETIEHAFHNRSVGAHGCMETPISDNGSDFTI